MGMTVAGGMSSRGWDLPIYVTNVDSDGVVGQEGSIRKGNKELQKKSLDVSIHYSHVYLIFYKYQIITHTFISKGMPCRGLLHK